ncbi:hypothetical protein [Campylobacter showae]|uniref:hypothetical protein n=1 Tax=Campylobacter showae TaxID=204 RepID=UPI0028D50BD9|nr:hypothetical protein [Campylobacter showae]
MRFDVTANIELAEIIDELRASDLGDILSAFSADDIADAILELSQSKIDNIIEILKDNQ